MTAQIPGMLKLSQRFGNSHQRFLGELELVRQSAMRDFNELTNERAVAVENLKRDKGGSLPTREFLAYGLQRGLRMFGIGIFCRIT